MGIAYLVGKDEESFLASHPYVIRDLVMVTKLACQQKRYAGQEWGVFGMFAPMETLVVSDAKKKVLVESGYLDLVLHFLCTLYRGENAAEDLMSRLSLGIDMSMHKKAFRHEQGYVANPDTLRLCMQLLIHLSFSSQIVQDLRELKNELGPVINLVSKCNSEKKEQVIRLLNQLRLIIKLNDGTNTSEQQGHIMISYSLSQQTVVKLFAESLKMQGYNV